MANCEACGLVLTPGHTCYEPSPDRKCAVCGVFGGAHLTTCKTLSTPPAPDAVKRYFVRSRIERMHGSDYEMPCSVEMIDASDYDSLARQFAEYKRRFPEQECMDLVRDLTHAERQRDALKARVDALTTQTNNLMNTVSFKQSQIDSLMFEFCPGEMSAEQRAEWARNQAPASQQEVDDIRSALTGDQP